MGRAFEEEGYCVVRGPDVIWGGDVKDFHPPAGVFEGVIGGPPCQAHSSAAMNKRRLDRDMTVEFIRIIQEANPDWFLYENTRRAPTPEIEGYHIDSLLFNNRWAATDDITGPEQNRMRKIVYGAKNGVRLIIDSIALFVNPNVEWCVTATESKSGRPGHGPYSGRRKPRKIERQCELMGLPGDFLKDAPFTQEGKGRVIGNGVAMPTGRAIARAVKVAAK